MGTYTFAYTPDEGGSGAEILAQINSDDYLPFVLAAFEQFLLGVTYQPGSIAKYIDVAKVQRDLIDYLANR
jgi:hypothetical protein